MSTVVVTQASDLKRVLKEVMLEIDNERLKNQPEKVYSVNSVAKQIGKAHATVKKLIRAGYLKTTADGSIPESSIRDYLSNLH